MDSKQAYRDQIRDKQIQEIDERLAAIEAKLGLAVRQLSKAAK